MLVIYGIFAEVMAYLNNIKKLHFRNVYKNMYKNAYKESIPIIDL